jgi:salicylate hydroxylase
MAIEDAAVLAKALSEGQTDTAENIAAALKRYARLRRTRVAQV